MFKNLHFVVLIVAAVLSIESSLFANPEFYNLAPSNSAWVNCGVTGEGYVVGVSGSGVFSYIGIDGDAILLTDNTGQHVSNFSPLYFDDLSELEYYTTGSSYLYLCVSREYPNSGGSIVNGGSSDWTSANVQYALETLAGIDVHSTYNFQKIYEAVILCFLCLLLFDLIYRSILER